MTDDEFRNLMNKFRGHVALSTQEVNDATAAFGPGVSKDALVTNLQGSSLATVIGFATAADRKNLAQILADEAYKIIEAQRQSMVGPPRADVGGGHDTFRFEMPLNEALYFIPEGATDQEALNILWVLCPKQIAAIRADLGFRDQALLDFVNRLRANYVAPPRANYKPGTEPSLEDVLWFYESLGKDIDKVIAFWLLVSPTDAGAFILQQGGMAGARQFIRQYLGGYKRPSNPPASLSIFRPVLPSGKSSRQSLLLPPDVPGALQKAMGDVGPILSEKLADIAGGIFPVLNLNQGRDLLTTDFTLHANWGLAATISALVPARPNLNRFRLSILAGTSTGANPTVLLTPSPDDVQPQFWENMPLVFATCTSDDSSVTPAAVYAYWDDDGLHITYKGTPTAGKKYLIDCFTVG